jgi:hypothetical protein
MVVLDRKKGVIGKEGGREGERERERERHTHRSVREVARTC